jgi:HSP20 family protein
MTITNVLPARSLSKYHDDFGRLLNSFFGTLPNIGRETGYLCPQVDIGENENEYTVQVELPGVKKGDVKITLKDNILTIEGEKKFEKKSKSDNYHCSERTFGKFMRSFELPQTVNQESIGAEFENGILRIAIPKSKAALPKQIEVKVK